MRFRQRQQSSQLPQINLVPMLDVLMTVLTFFIIVSMTLALEQGVEVQLPNNQASTPPQAAPEPLVVKLSPQGILLHDQSAAEPQVLQQVQTYLKTNAKGAVVLQAAPQTPYDQVVHLLTEMKAIGGDRVSLAIE